MDVDYVDQSLYGRPIKDLIWSLPVLTCHPALSPCQLCFMTAGSIGCTYFVDLSERSLVTSSDSHRGTTFHAEAGSQSQKGCTSRRPGVEPFCQTRGVQVRPLAPKQRILIAFYLACEAFTDTYRTMTTTSRKPAWPDVKRDRLTLSEWAMIQGDIDETYRVNSRLNIKDYGSRSLSFIIDCLSDEDAQKLLDKVYFPTWGLTKAFHITNPYTGHKVELDCNDSSIQNGWQSAAGTFCAMRFAALPGAVNPNALYTDISKIWLTRVRQTQATRAGSQVTFVWECDLSTTDLHDDLAAVHDTTSLFLFNPTHADAQLATFFGSGDHGEGVVKVEDDMLHDTEHFAFE